MLYIIESKLLAMVRINIKNRTYFDTTDKIVKS